MVKVPCQDIVMNIIPAIQASLAAELVSLGITQVQAAKALSVAPSAVSQYLSGKRGYRIVFEDVLRNLQNHPRGRLLSASLHKINNPFFNERGKRREKFPYALSAFSRLTSSKILVRITSSDGISDSNAFLTWIGTPSKR